MTRMPIAEHRHCDLQITRNAANNVGIRAIEAAFPFQGVYHEPHCVFYTRV